ncbi:MAG: dockerin type I repeat-containing protein [Bacillota bacterium]|nr:dockerin type I repeat-containing protein [Bacillota bacterium]
MPLPLPLRPLPPLLVVLLSGGLLWLWTAKLRSCYWQLPLPELVERFSRLPLLPFLLLLLGLSFLLLFYFREFHLKKDRISLSSVRESLDHLHTALCFSWPSGMLMLSNHRMNQLSYTLLGEELQNTEDFWDFLCGEDAPRAGQRLSSGQRPEFCLPDGSFKPGTAYTLSVLMSLYDENENGLGDTAVFAAAEDISVYHGDELGLDPVLIDCSVEQHSNTELLITYTFPATEIPSLALSGSSQRMAFRAVEGYQNVEPQSFSLYNLGSGTIEEENISIINESGFLEMEREGLDFSLTPGPGLEAGEYYSTLGFYYSDEDYNESSCFLDVYFTVEEAVYSIYAEPANLYFELMEGYKEVESQSITILNNGNTEIPISSVTVSILNEDPNLNVSPAFPQVEVAPVLGMEAGSYSGSFLVSSDSYGQQFPVNVYVEVAEAPSLGLRVSPEESSLSLLEGYDSSQPCLTLEVESFGEEEITELLVKLYEDMGVALLPAESFSSQTRYEDGKMLVDIYPAAGLAAGSYKLKAELWDPEERSSCSASLELSVEALSYTLSCRPDHLEFSANKGYSGLSQQVNVLSTGTGEISSIQAAIYSAAGGLSTDFSCSVDGMQISIIPVDGLEAGSYIGTLEIRDTEGRASTTVSLACHVAECSINVVECSLSTDLTAFQLALEEGKDLQMDFLVSALVDETSQNLVAAALSFPDASENWLSLSGQGLQYSLSTEGLSIGEYTAELELSLVDIDYSVTIPISLVVGEALGYGIEADPSTVDFGSINTDSTPAEEKISILSVGSGEITEITAQVLGEDGMPSTDFVFRVEGMDIYIRPAEGLAPGHYAQRLLVTNEEHALGTYVDLIVQVLEEGENSLSGTFRSYWGHYDVEHPEERKPRVFLVQGEEMQELECRIEEDNTGSGGMSLWRFQGENLPDGAYELLIRQPGYLDFRVTGILLGGGVHLMMEASPTEELHTIILLAGDVNGDQSINASDFNLIRSSANYYLEVNEATEPLADVNRDGSINATDINIIRSSRNYYKGVDDCIYSYE